MFSARWSLVAGRWSLLPVATRRFFGGSHFTAGTNMRLVRVGRKCDGTHLIVATRRLGTKNHARKKTVFALTSLTLTTTTGSRKALTFSLSSGVAFLHDDKPNSMLCTRTHRHCVNHAAKCCRVSIAGRRKGLVTAFRSDMFEGKSGVAFSLPRASSSDNYPKRS